MDVVGASISNASIRVLGSSLYLVPLNKGVMYEPGYPFDGCMDQARSDARVRIDGLSMLDVCVRTHGGHASHVYVLGNPEADSTEVRIWATTTKK